MSIFRRKPKLEDRTGALVKDLEIPVFSAQVSKILQRLREPNVDMAAVAEALAWDPGLMTQILSTVNSSAYGPRTPISDIAHAASYMGAAALEHIVTVIAVKEVLPTNPAPGFRPAEFWHEAGTRAALARRLSDHLHPELTAEVFTSGLLSDLAVPLLVQNRPGAYGRVLDAWNGNRAQDLAEMERKAFGWDHADVGGALARHWGLPNVLIQGITDHHGDRVAPALQLVSVLQDSVAEFGADNLFADAHHKYGVDPDWLRESLELSREEALELIRALG